MFLFQGAERVWPAGAVHDTVAAVLRDAAFRRSMQRSLADVISLWLAEWFGRLARFVRLAPSARSVAIALVILIVVGVASRALIASRARGEEAERLGRRRGTAATDDPWQAADELLARGQFEAAAHAMYRGVLNGLTQGERVRFDPSKTSGDYARELRRRGASSYAPFRAFVQRFDVAVYGHGGCDADAVVELRALATPFRAKARAA